MWKKYFFRLLPLLNSSPTVAITTQSSDLVHSLWACSVCVSDHNLAHWQVFLIGEHSCVVRPVMKTRGRRLVGNINHLGKHAQFLPLSCTRGTQAQHLEAEDTAIHNLGSKLEKKWSIININSAASLRLYTSQGKLSSSTKADVGD